MTEAVRAAGGRMFLQLQHGGRASHPATTGLTPVAPSPVPLPETIFTPGGHRPSVVPREMTVDDIRSTVADFAAAARRAVEAGFEGVGNCSPGSATIWDAGYGASVRGPCSTGVMVQGLPVASGRTHMARSHRELASRARTTHRMRVTAPGLSTPGTSAPKTVRGVRLSGLTPAQSKGTVEVHSANGHLLHQFLAGNTNRRTDGYGGSPQRWTRFTAEATEAVGGAVGYTDYPTLDAQPSSDPIVALDGPRVV